MQGQRAVLPYPRSYATLAGTLLPWHCTSKFELLITAVPTPIPGCDHTSSLSSRGRCQPC